MSCSGIPVRTMPGTEWKFFKNDRDGDTYVKRDFLNDSIYTERVFTSLKYPEKSYCCDTFKLVRGSLYYCLNNNFYPYFSVKAFESGDTIVKYDRNTVLFAGSRSAKKMSDLYRAYRKQTVEGREVYSFLDIKESGKDSQGNYVNLVLIYFDPDEGIVGYSSSRKGAVYGRKVDDPFKR